MQQRAIEGRKTAQRGLTTKQPPRRTRATKHNTTYMDIGTEDKTRCTKHSCAEGNGKVSAAGGGRGCAGSRSSPVSDSAELTQAARRASLIHMSQLSTPAALTYNCMNVCLRPSTFLPAVTEQLLRSGSLTGKPVYWGRTSCTLSVRSTWIVRSTFYSAEQVDLSIVTAVTFR